MVGYGVSLVEDGGIRRSLVEDGGLRRLRRWMAAADGGVVVAGQGCEGRGEGMWKKGMGKKVIVTIKQETHTDDQSGHSKESGRAKITSMCYIPFSSLMHKALWNGNISFFILRCTFKVELVPRRSEDGSTNCSEFWDGQVIDRKTVSIQKASATSMEITWLH
ncbi:hypothetical protein QVD17_31754 [Tagetes erecta]|uniref:Uncharacterized protein n=1 Tax=Tagetes erecta TaxID=13708 RepID=A0AAD8NPJ4_TARER|nr:hypothetical protein QVD17_31754 [Tagetes erecta]